MIGVFDSGYGGLSVFAELIKRIPEQDFIYLGDNARAPYGNRSPEIITEYTREALEWLFKQGVSLAVLACNTASSQALPQLRPWLAKKYPAVQVLGVVEPVIQAVRRNASSKPVGVIATKATIRSGVYAKGLAPRFVVVEKACPLLVSLVEEGMTDGPITEQIIAEYLKPLLAEGVGTLVLGCTHYYFLKKVIERIAPELIVVDASREVPEYVELLLRDNPRANGSSVRGSRKFFTTDEKDDFARFVERHLKLSIEPVRISL